MLNEWLGLKGIPFLWAWLRAGLARRDPVVMLEFRFVLYSWPDGTRETAQTQDHPDSAEQNENSIPYWYEHCLNCLWSFRGQWPVLIHTAATGQNILEFLLRVLSIIDASQMPTSRTESWGRVRSEIARVIFSFFNDLIFLFRVHCCLPPFVSVWRCQSLWNGS